MIQKERKITTKFFKDKTFDFYQLKYNLFTIPSAPIRPRPVTRNLTSRTKLSVAIVFLVQIQPNHRKEKE